MIDVSNLHIGLTVKGYKGMCTTVGDEYKGSNTKGIAYQKKDWQRYFEWIEHTRYRWEVTAVHNEVKPKEDGRKDNKGGNNNVYSDHIDYLLLDYLDKHEMIDGTFKVYRDEFNILNENYDQLYDNIPKLASELKINQWYLWEFFANTKRLGMNILCGSLKRLSNNNCLSYEKRKMAGQIGSGKTKYWEVTPEEDKKMSEIRENTLREMGFTNEQAVIYAGRWLDYDEDVVSRMDKELGIDFIFNQYTAIIIPLTGQREKSETRMFEIYNKYDDEEQDEIDHQQTLNQKICSRIIEGAVKRHLAAIDKASKADIGFGDWDIDQVTQYRMSEEYVERYKQFVDLFVKVEFEENNNLMEAVN